MATTLTLGRLLPRHPGTRQRCQVQAPHTGWPAGPQWRVLLRLDGPRAASPAQRLLIREAAHPPFPCARWKALRGLSGLCSWRPPSRTPRLGPRFGSARPSGGRGAGQAGPVGLGPGARTPVGLSFPALAPPQAQGHGGCRRAAGQTAVLPWCFGGRGGRRLPGSWPDGTHFPATAREAAVPRLSHLRSQLRRPVLRPGPETPVVGRTRSSVRTETVPGLLRAGEGTGASGLPPGGGLPWPRAGGAGLGLGARCETAPRSTLRAWWGGEPSRGPGPAPTAHTHGFRLPRGSWAGPGAGRWSLLSWEHLWSPLTSSG